MENKKKETKKGLQETTIFWAEASCIVARIQGNWLRKSTLYLKNPQIFENRTFDVCAILSPYPGYS